MEIKKQTLDKVEFTLLKGLKNINIDFKDKNVTAIFGINGCGKSTILHALACLYQPVSDTGEKNYFTRFFKRENRVTWIGSELCAHFTIEGNTHTKKYEKSGDRWTPRIDKRPKRDVIYIGINSCVPDIEQATATVSSFIMEAEEAVDLRDQIIKSASRIMNYTYENYAKAPFRGKKYKKVARKNGDLNYSSLAMGAGEQRLFSLLERLYSMPPYSLLLIDELDLTLHTSALMRLIDEMVKVSRNKNLQIIFTTHREELAFRTDINIRHIWNANDGSQSFVLDRTTPDCLHRLTGNMQKNLEIYVEDDLAEYTARQAVRDKGLLPYTSFHRFGAIENAFVVAAGLDIQEEDSENKIFILDGDKYRSDKERSDQMKKCYSGTEVYRDERRARALSHIKQFILPAGKQPEHFLWERLKESDNQLATYAKEMPEYSKDKHGYLYYVQLYSGESRESFLTQLTNILAKQDFWPKYIQELNEWLDNRKAALGL